MNPNTYIPTTPDDFVGTPRQFAEHFLKMLADSQANQFAPMKVLLHGAPGIGKSGLVKFMQHAAGIHPKWSTTKLSGTKVNMAAIDDMEATLHYRDLYGAYKLIWIEEADAIPTTAQIRMLTFLDDIPNGVILACTSNARIADFEPRFQSRFEAHEFHPVPTGDIEKLLLRFVPAQYAAQVKHIAVMAAGNVRQALLDAKGLMVAVG